MITIKECSIHGKVEHYEWNGVRKNGYDLHIVQCKPCAQAKKKNNKEKTRLVHKAWASKLRNKKRRNELALKNRETRLIKRNFRIAKVRLEVLSHYSNSEIKCACCGDTHIKFMTLDHIFGEGNKHRREIKRTNIWYWARKNKYPTIFQVLCHNCNYAKSHGGCPHKNNKEN